MNYIGANTEELDDGEVTEPFDHVTYASFRYVDPKIDPSEVTATVERRALDSSVDPDEIVPAHSSIRAAEPASACVETVRVAEPERAGDAPIPVEIPAPAEEVAVADDLVSDDDVFEMESIATHSGVTPASRPSAPPPLPARASVVPPSRGSDPPPTMRVASPPSEPEPALFAIEIVSLPAATPVVAPPVDEVFAGLEAVASVPLAMPVVSAIQAPLPPPAPVTSFAPQAAAFPPAFAAPPPFTPPSFQFNETPSTAPVAMASNAGMTGEYEPMSRKGIRLSPAALAALIVLLGSSVLAFGTVLALRVSRAHASAVAATESPAESESTMPAPATTAPQAASAVPTVAPAALPSVVASVAVESLPKITVDPAMTLVSTPASAKGHRVFVDGRVVGNAGAALQVKCGDHSVKIGSASKARAVHFPCGGEASID